MPDAAWPKVRESFDAALRRRPEERRSFVNEACGDDKTLLAEVESLLASHDGAESFIEKPAVAKVDHCYKWTEEGFRKSIEYFEKALEKDPENLPQRVFHAIPCSSVMLI